MESYDGPEVCEIVGLLLLHYTLLLILDCIGTGQLQTHALTQAERMKKKTIKLFKGNSLCITIVMTKCIANFLDATLD